jgi:hypothetical protein
MTEQRKIYNGHPSIQWKEILTENEIYCSEKCLGFKSFKLPGSNDNWQQCKFLELARKLDEEQTSYERFDLCIQLESDCDGYCFKKSL